MELLTSTYQNKISGTLDCFDRIVLSGTIPGICYSQGMTSYLYQQKIRIFDYPQFAHPLKERIRKNAEKIAADNGLEIEFIRKSYIRKESLVAEKLKQRGHHNGLVHIISAMEGCSSYKPWHNKKTGKTFLKGDTSKCLHYYFYFMDEYLGLGYVRVPTWCPFRLQVYFNGHGVLKNKLDQEGIGYTMIDNAFDSIEDWDRAQQLAGDIQVDKIHARLDYYAHMFCPVVHEQFEQVYHWSIMQAEMATDIVFKKQQDLQEIYSELVQTAIHIVKPDNIATFLGKKLDPRFIGEVGNNYNIRIEGSRIKHSMGSNSIKMYDKFSKILRIETTTNDVSFFKHYRKVEHKDGTSSKKLAGMKKYIYSLGALQGMLKASNKRYLTFISGIESKSAGQKRLKKVAEPKKENNRNYKGFNFFNKDDLDILFIILRGEYNISGFQNKDLRHHLPEMNTGRVSRLLKRLLVHGLIKKVRNTYKYYLTMLGKEVLLTAEKLKQAIIIPSLNY
ncbi:MAG: winged helix-turn-helix transcriptional regulator [Bacteroidales bacterium]|nr:winged helix-turn-helix transcriptional regulator [Bacteroidales bacterium]